MRSVHQMRGCAWQSNGMSKGGRAVLAVGTSSTELLRVTPAELDALFQHSVVTAVLALVEVTLWHSGFCSWWIPRETGKFLFLPPWLL